MDNQREESEENCQLAGLVRTKSLAQEVEDKFEQEESEAERVRRKKEEEEKRREAQQREDDRLQWTAKKRNPVDLD